MDLTLINIPNFGWYNFPKMVKVFMNDNLDGQRKLS